MASESSQISITTVYIMVLGFFVALVGGLFSIWGTVIGSLIIAGAAFMGYAAQGGPVNSTKLPSLHRELAKTHCGQCGAAMRSNMMFCPSCGARQTQTQ